MNQSLVLVTGAGGFLGGHVINLLLRGGYRVRGTVRNLKNSENYQHIYKIYPSKNSNLELVEADINDKNCWSPLMKNCDFVIHTAAPFTMESFENPNDFVIPAVNALENVVQAAIINNVKKMVITGSVINSSAGNMKNQFDENDNANPDTSTTYEQSKYLSEKRAWDLIEENRKKNPQNYTKLSFILPGLILGPSFSNVIKVSGEIIQQLMTGKIPVMPKISFSVVDVREVAQAHINCLENSNSNGKRYLISENSYWFEDVAKILKEEYGQYGYKLPSMTLGKFVLNIIACFDKNLRNLKPLFDRFIEYNNQKSKNELGIQYRSLQETLKDTVIDQISKDLIPDLINNRKQKDKSRRDC